MYSTNGYLAVYRPADGNGIEIREVVAWSPGGYAYVMPRAGSAQADRADELDRFLAIRPNTLDAGQRQELASMVGQPYWLKYL